jgi:hypothetical protein
MAESQFVHGDLSAAQAAATLSCSGDGGVAIQIAGSFSGTVSFEGSVDGVNFRALLVTPSNSTTQVTSATAAGLWTATAIGLVVCRARMSSYTSGTAQVSLRGVVASPGGSSSGGGGGGGTSSTFGDPFPAAGTAAGFIDHSGNMAGATLDASGNLLVNVAAGSSGNAAASATGAAVPADADYLGIKDSSGNLLGVAGTNLDYDTGAGTVAQTVLGLALPASGGPVAAIGGSGVVTTGTQRVTLATDVALPAGTNVIGHVVADSGSTTAVTQATAANLNATVVGTGTFAVQEATLDGATDNTNHHIIVGQASDFVYIGTTALTPKWSTITASTSGADTQVVAVTSKKIRVVALALTSNGTVNVKFQSHVTPTDITGLFYEIANTGFVLPYNPMGWFQTVAGEALDINLSASVAVGGVLQYVEV